MGGEIDVVNDAWGSLSWSTGGGVIKMMYHNKQVSIKFKFK